MERCERKQRKDERKRTDGKEKDKLRWKTYNGWMCARKVDGWMDGNDRGNGKKKVESEVGKLGMWRYQGMRARAPTN